MILNNIMKDLLICAFREKYKINKLTTSDTIAQMIITVWHDDENIKHFFDGTHDALSLNSLAYLYQHLNMSDEKIDKLIQKYNLQPN